MSGAPRAGVLGLGLIGGSLLKGLASVGAEPAGADADAAVAGAARAEGFRVVAGAAELARECDVVLVCVPPAHTAHAVAELLAAGPDVVVADTASVKAPVLAAVAAAVPPDALGRYVPAHPLAGSELGGWAAADAALVREAVWAVCPSGGESLGALCALAAALEPLGPRLLASEAGTHDAALARSSHVPHVAAQALARLPGLPLGAALSGGAYRDMTRTARSDPALWLDIVGANREAVGAGLRELLAELERLAAAVEAGDDAVLAEAWRAGAAARATVDAVRWTEPAWRPHRVPASWEALLDLGRAGVLFRRPRTAGDALELETGGAPG